MQRARRRPPVLFRLCPAVCVLERASFFLDSKRVTSAPASALSSRSTSNLIDRGLRLCALPAAARIALAARTPFSSPPLQPSPPRTWRCVTIPPEKRQKQRFCGHACDAHADARRSRHGSEPVATRTRLAEDAPAAHDSREAQTTLARRTRFAPASHGTRTRPAPPAHRTRTRRAQTEATRQIEHDKSDVSS